MSTICLNANGLNSLVRRHNEYRFTRKQNSTLSCLQERHLNSDAKHGFRIKDWKIIIKAIKSLKITTTLVSNSVAFKL